MGLFDFVKNAGRKLGFGRGEEKEAIAEAEKAAALRQLIIDLGLEAENLAVSFDDGVAMVTGTVASKEEAEKIVLALGNTNGVAQVDDRLSVVEPQPESDSPIRTRFATTSTTPDGLNARIDHFLLRLPRRAFGAEPSR